MKQFLAFVRKEFFHILRDRRTILILLVMPIVQIILFGFAINTEVQHIRVAILDPCNDVATLQLRERIDANPYFEVSNLIHTPNAADELFRRNKVDLVVVFENPFQEQLLHTGRASLQLITDATDPNMATTIANYATQLINAYQQELRQQQPFPMMQVTPQIKLLYNPQMKSAYNFVPGVMGLILMLICAMMTSVSIVREKERGTMEVLLVSPIQPLSIILAKAVPYLLLSLVNLCTILLLSVYLLQVPVAGSLFWLAVVSFLFIFVALALGLLVSTLVDSQVAAMLLSGMVLMIPVILLSGMIFPIESMPLLLQWISHIIPARWFIAAVKKIMIEGLDISYAWKELSILIGMALFLMIVSIKKFKYRLQ